MSNRYVIRALPALFLLAAVSAGAQSFRVQCPARTITHPDPSNTGVNNSEPSYTGPTTFGTVATKDALKVDRLRGDGCQQNQQHGPARR